MKAHVEHIVKYLHAIAELLWFDLYTKLEKVVHNGAKWFHIIFCLDHNGSILLTFLLSHVFAIQSSKQSWGPM